MRSNAPFEELLTFVNDKEAFDLPKLPLEDHAHVPYVVLLLQGAAKWREEHDGNMPKNFAEKKEKVEWIAEPTNERRMRGTNLDTTCLESVTQQGDPGGAKMPYAASCLQEGATNLYKDYKKENNAQDEKVDNIEKD